jgi:ankyrin repeat protein
MSASADLCNAAQRGHVRDIERLVARGADVNVNEGGYDGTPLQFAASNGHVAAMEVLLRLGAHVDGQTSYGNTPLIYAMARGFTPAAELLLAAGADTSVSDRSGQTPLHYAATLGHVDAVQVLLHGGARTDLRDKRHLAPVDMVRVPAAPAIGSAAAAFASTRLPTPRLQPAQVCARGKPHNRDAILAVIAGSLPWCRRRAVTVATYADVWDWGE